MSNIFILLGSAIKSSSVSLSESCGGASVLLHATGVMVKGVITNQIGLLLQNAAFLLFLTSQSNTTLFALLCFFVSQGRD